MTDQEKIIRHDTLMELRQLIGGCFGCADGLFALHSADEERAKNLRKIAVECKIPLCSRAIVSRGEDEAASEFEGVECWSA